MKSMMTRIREAIEKNITIYRGVDPHVDTVGAAIAVLRIYEGDRYEDVMRGGESVARTREDEA